MKLVGANPWFIRLPFIIEGMMYGFFAAWVSLLFFYPLVYFSSPFLASIAPQINIVSYLQTQAPLLIAVQLLSGIFLGAISSMIAIRKYLKV